MDIAERLEGHISENIPECEVVLDVGVAPGDHAPSLAVVNLSTKKRQMLLHQKGKPKPTLLLFWSCW